MFVAGQKEMQQMDGYTIEQIGLPGVVLMENAGARVVEEIIGSVGCKNAKVVILAGGGNNGGDGFVIARRLVDLGWKPDLWLLVEQTKITGDAKCHFDVYMNRGLPISSLEEHSLEYLCKALTQADIIVDAILGTGVKGQVRDPLKQVISLVNEFADQKMIIAVDIPSGLNSDNGKIGGIAVKATKTVTFVFPKKGFFLEEGPDYVGDWKAVDISVPPSIVHELNLKLPQMITESIVKESIPKRKQNGHKGTFGHALVVGGSRSYVGAPIFTAKAVLHSGAGLVTMAVPESIYHMVATQNPESLFLPLTEEDGHFSEESLNQLIPKLPQFNSIAVGPGMSRFPGGEEWMKRFIHSLEGQSVVVDADGLFMLRNQLDILQQYNGSVILTPHPGEMAILTNKTVREVEENRLETAKLFAEKHHVFLLLKGHRSIIATPEGEVFINPHGHDALGKGGSGDVLTGLIASFLAQGANPLHALLAASYLHAKAGEDQAKRLSHYGVMPYDLIEGVKCQLNALTKK
ncbi:NAD(P)H-hydrate dehydratase [Bacillus sp. B15-48]|uniref:NAD(P)H-hydrate dehydratase n=1 Tax=Bacillus sp. B15-48 TaxID=1548601 RepID=UPI00193F678F|nr:NAD(P)H-hydrate dehydratase [Bacillus sp. B15-48]MBM4764505.1 NAD(P)H-hydrate dehydratase [Bacillus sp. B15-48]